MATTATRRFRGLSVLMLMVALAGCAGDTTGPDEEPDTEHKMVIQNDSSLTIDEVYLSFCSEETWGPNDLPDGDTIEPGSSASWTFPEPACLDIRVVATTGASAEDFDIQLDGTFTWTVTD